MKLGQTREIGPFQMHDATFAAGVWEMLHQAGRIRVRAKVQAGFLFVFLRFELSTLCHHDI